MTSRQQHACAFDLAEAWLLAKAAGAKPLGPPPTGWRPSAQGPMAWTGRTMRRPSTLTNEEVRRAHPLNRLITKPESKNIWNRWTQVYNQPGIGDGPITAGADVEDRFFVPRSGTPRPRVYDNRMGWTLPNGRQYHWQPADPRDDTAFAQDFDTLVNRIRPDKLSIAPGPSGSAAPRGGPYGGTMELNPSAQGQHGAEVAVHELEHTSQYKPWRNAVNSGTDETALYELPAVLAGTATEARDIMRATRAGILPPGWKPEDAENAVFNLAPGYSPNHRGFRGLTAKTMANQATRHMWGEDPYTGERTQKPRTMTELLSTPEGQSYLRLLNQENAPGTAAAQAATQERNGYWLDERMSDLQGARDLLYRLEEDSALVENANYEAWKRHAQEFIEATKQEVDHKVLPTEPNSLPDYGRVE